MAADKTPYQPEEDPRICTVLDNGSKEWRNAAGQLDSWNDLPAVIWSDNPILSSPGACLWYKNGKLHRDNDLPARVEPSGYQEWWHEGAPARPSGGPNIVDANGAQEWTDAQMRRHREGDLPALITAGGTQGWFKHGELHRDTGLALIKPDGTGERYVNGKAVPEEMPAPPAKAAARKNTSAPKP